MESLPPGLGEYGSPGALERLERIGKGSFGEVYRARVRLTGAVVVLKQVDLSGLNPKQRSEAANEVRVLAGLPRHPNVVAHLGSFVDLAGERLNIVMEYADRGSLFDRVQQAKDRSQPLEEVEIWQIFAQLTLALHHVHQAGVLHRDIKSANVFLASPSSPGSGSGGGGGAGEGASVVKLGDFGVAKHLLCRADLATTCIGTPYYLSPEICLNRPYGAKSDVWSLGVVLYELCSLRHPFDASCQAALIMKIIHGQYPQISARYTPALSEV
eukprot:RCo035187